MPLHKKNAKLAETCKTKDQKNLAGLTARFKGTNLLL